MKKLLFKHSVLASFLILMVCGANAQTYQKDIARDSARSDSRTGSVIEKAEILENDTNLLLSVNIPSFEMTLWQNEKEIKKYYVGVGLKDYPIFVGLRNIDTIIWNPAWIPPPSDWVAPELQGQVIGPADPRNPLGKIKIPLGYGYLIHQAKGIGDLGSMVSHGCVRVMRDDLYDLNDKILAAHGLDLSAEVAKAKKNRTTFVIETDEPIKLEVSYDTIVIENGILNIYPDIYEHNTNTPSNLRSELEKNGLDSASLSDSTIKEMFARATGKNKFQIPVIDLRKGNYPAGKVTPVVPSQKPTVKKKKG